MADTNNFVQIQTLHLAGAGVGTTDTSIILTSMKYPDASTNVVMADFGTTGYATLEPGSEREENISFTGITQNANGTATLTGVTRGLNFKTPYTASAALRQAHAGGTSCVVSNSAPFYDKLAAKGNDETVTGTWTFTSTAKPIFNANPTFTDDKELITKKYADDLAIAGAPDSSTTVKGLVEKATSAETQSGTDAGGTTAPLFAAPSDIAANTQNQKHVLCTVGGTATAVTLTPTPAITAYATGQRFVFAATSAVTGASTVNVSGLGVKNIKKYENGAIANTDNNDWISGQIVDLEYDGTQFILQSNKATGMTAGANYEAQTFFSATDITGSEAETLTNGSDADSLHTHVEFREFGVNTSNKTTYMTYMIPIGTTGSWTAGGTPTVFGNAIKVETNGTAVIQNVSDGLVGSVEKPVTFANTKVFRVSFPYKNETTGANQSKFIGLATDAGGAYTRLTATTKRIGFIIENATLYSTVANGTSQTSNVLTGVTIANYNTYTIVWSPGVDAKFYVNGVLKDTITTNIPSGAGTVRFGAAGADSGGNASAFYLGSPTISQAL